MENVWWAKSWRNLGSTSSARYGAPLRTDGNYTDTQPPNHNALKELGSRDFSSSMFGYSRGADSRKLCIYSTLDTYDNVPKLKSNSFKGRVISESRW